MEVRVDVGSGDGFNLWLCSGCAQSQASLRIVWRWILKGVSRRTEILTKGAQINLRGH
jgi:hypothetical protein